MFQAINIKTERLYSVKFLITSATFKRQAIAAEQTGEINLHCERKRKLQLMKTDGTEYETLIKFLVRLFFGM